MGLIYWKTPNDSTASDGERLIFRLVFGSCRGCHQLQRTWIYNIYNMNILPAFLKGNFRYIVFVKPLCWSRNISFLLPMIIKEEIYCRRRGWCHFLFNSLGTHLPCSFTLSMTFKWLAVYIGSTSIEVAIGHHKNWISWSKL